MDDTEEVMVNELYLHYSTQFKASRVIGKLIFPTNFRLEGDVWLNMDGYSQEDRDYNLNLSLIKIDFFFKSIIDNSIIVSKDNELSSSFIDSSDEHLFDNNLIKTPSEPTDDHLAMVLQSKMTSLSKDLIVFGSIKIKSDNSKGLSFTFVGDGHTSLPSMEEWVGERTYFEDPWWLRDDSSTFDIVPPENADLSNKPDFAFDLDFLGESLKPDYDNINQANVLKPKFRPRIITNDDESET